MFNKGCVNHTTKVNVNFKSLNLTLVAKSGSHRETNQLTGRLLRWGDRKLLSGDPSRPFAISVWKFRRGLRRTRVFLLLSRCWMFLFCEIEMHWGRFVLTRVEINLKICLPGRINNLLEKYGTLHRKLRLLGIKSVHKLLNYFWKKKKTELSLCLLSHNWGDKNGICTLLTL